MQVEAGKQWDEFKIKMEMSWEETRMKKWIMYKKKTHLPAVQLMYEK